MGSLRLRDALFRHRARGSERSSSIRFRIPLAYLVLALGAILPAAAQTVSASISGSVTDPAGIPVADALVIVQSQETAALRRAATGPDGRFEFNMLRPGQYTVRVEAVGFRAFVREHVALALQGAMVLDVVLSPALVEEVSVSGDAPVLDPSNTSGGISVGKREILALPSAGRVFTDLALLDASLRPVAPGTFYGERAAGRPTRGPTPSVMCGHRGPSR